jgi:DNA-binding NtrC family response regulator
MTSCKILIVDDDDVVLLGYRQLLTKSGYRTTEATSLAEAKETVWNDDFDIVVLDLKLPDGNAIDWIPELKKSFPDLPVIVITGTGDIPTAVTAMKSGAENFLTKPVDPETLEMALRTAIELGGLRRQNRVHRRLGKSAAPFVGKGASGDNLCRLLEVAAANDTVLLMLGETGTGKGVFSRWIHDHGARANEPFVELNCSCLKGDLLRSELYGHTKGAFTSAVSDREGLVEMADRGTLFLDEIGDMDLAVQAQLLKTIEERSYRRLGDNRLRKSNFRLICATNKDLQKEVKEGAFRPDLYYRINVFPVTIPPLRQRPEDIPGLVEHFLAEFGYSDSALSPESLATLLQYPWPGNIRELRNVLERALLLGRNGPLTIDCFSGLGLSACSPSCGPPDKPADLREIEREYVLKTIEACNGDKKKASQMLGISPATLYRKLGKPPM